MGTIQAKAISLFLLLITLCATGLDAVTWTPPEVAGSSYSDYGAIACDQEGNAVAVFEHFPDEKSVCVQASIKKVGQDWSTPVNLSAVVAITDQSLFPSVCIDANGNAVAVWNVLSGKKKQLIQAASLPAGSDTWIKANANLSKPVTLVGPAILGMDGEGVATAGWMYTENDGTSSIKAARVESGSSSWTSLQTLHIPNWSSFFSMAVDAQGMMHCIWLERMKERKKCPFSFDTVGVATLDSGNNIWKGQQTLSLGRCVTNAALYVDPKGDCLVTWTYLNTAQKCWNFEIFKKMAGKARWFKTKLSEIPVSQEPDSFLTFDTSGNALFVFEPEDKKTYGPLLSAELPVKSHTWSAPKSALPLDEVVQFGAGMGQDSAGNVLFVWTNPKEHLLKFATRSATAGSDWSAPATIGAIKGSDVLYGIPKCAFSSTGSVMVIYPEVTDTSSVVNTVTGSSVFQ